MGRTEAPRAIHAVPSNRHRHARERRRRDAAPLPQHAVDCLVGEDFDLFASINVLRPEMYFHLDVRHRVGGYASFPKRAWLDVRKNGAAAADVAGAESAQCPASCGG